MNRWQEQFDNNAIHQTLEQLNEWLEIEVNDLNEGEVAELRRCKKIMTMISKSIANLDVEIISTQQLDSLNQQLRHQNIWNQLNSFGSNGNVQHITNVNNNLNPIVQYLTWLIPFSSAYSQDDTIVSLQNSVDQTLNSLVNKKTEFEQEIAELTSQVQELKNQKIQLEGTIEQRRKEVDNQISQWQQQFSDAQEKRTENYNDWRSNVETEVRNKSEELVSNTRDKIDTLENETSSNLDQLIQDASNKHQDITDLFHLASGDSISGGYSQFADKERFQSHLWRTVAISFICITAWWIFTAYNNVNPLSGQVSNLPVAKTGGAIISKNGSTSKLTKDNESPVITTTKGFGWHRFLLSFSLTGVLLFGAAYSGQQSNRHRENEKKMRWFALQIKALDPYINSLDPEDQKELKKTLSEKFFSGGEEMELQGKLVDEHAIGYISKAIIDAIKAARS